MRNTDAGTKGEHPVVATIERYDGAPDLCTIHLNQAGREPNSESVTTMWLSAEEGSYCSVREWR